MNPFTGAGTEDESFEQRWLDAIYRRDGHVYRTIAVSTSPTVIVEDLETGDRTTLVIGSPRHREYEELVPRPASVWAP